MASIDDRASPREKPVHDTNRELQARAARQQSAQRLQLADLFDKAMVRVSSGQTRPVPGPDSVSAPPKPGNALRQRPATVEPLPKALWKVPAETIEPPAREPDQAALPTRRKRATESSDGGARPAGPTCAAIALDAAPPLAAAPATSSPPPTRTVDLGRFETLAAICRHLENMQPGADESVYRLELAQPGGVRLALDFRGDRQGRWCVAVQHDGLQATRVDLPDLQHRLERLGLRIAAVDLDEEQA